MASKYRKFLDGITIVPKAGLDAPEKGDLQVLTTGKLYYYNGTSNSPVVTEAHQSTLTNKYLSDSSISIVDASDSTKQIKFDAVGSSNTFTMLTSSQTVNRTLTLPDATDTLVGRATSESLTNKTINADLNTITNIDNADIKAAAAIDRSKLASGTANHVLINDASGVMSSESALAISRGGTGQATQQAALNALAPSSPTYGQVIGYDGTNWSKKTLSAGPKNYITYNDFENNSTTGWSLFYTTLSAQKIPTGPITTYSPGTGLYDPDELSVISSPNLQGSYSLNVGGPTGWTAGNGVVSDAFTINNEDKSKVLAFSFYYYDVYQGGLDKLVWAGNNTNTLAVYIYDVTNGAWIQPAGVYNLTQGIGTGICSGTFQTTSNSTQYRLAILAINNALNSASVVFDDFYLGPQKVIQGPSGPVGEIIATGSLTPPAGFLYCDGQSVSVSQYQDLFNSIGYTYGGSGASFNLPDLRGIFARGAGTQTISGTTYSATLGTKERDQFQGHYHNKTAVDDTNYRLLNVATAGGVDANDGAPNFTTVAASNALNITSPSTDGTNGTPRTGAETQPANVAVAYHIRYLATYQMSSDTDTRVVDASYSVISQAITGATNRLQFDTLRFDTHASVTTGSSWVFTAPVSGYYNIAGYVETSSATAWTAGQRFFVRAIKDSVNDIVVGQKRFDAAITSVGSANLSGEIYLNAGSTLYFNIDTSVATTVTNPSWISISRRSGPATIAASETVSAFYQTNAGNQLTEATQMYIDFEDKVYDTHGAVTVSSSTPLKNSTVAATGWKFTAPVSGKYLVVCTMSFSSASATSTRAYFEITKNSATQFYSNMHNAITAVGNANVFLSGSATVDCLAGDTLQILGIQASGANRNMNTGTGQNSVAITRVGN